MAEWYSIVCIDYILFIYLSADEHLGCFHLLAIANNAAMNMDVQVPIQIPAFGSFGYIYLEVELMGPKGFFNER